MELLKLEVELCLHVFWRNSLRCLPQFNSIQPAMSGVVISMMCLERKSYTSSLVWDIAMTLHEWFYMVLCIWVHLSYFYWHPTVLFHVVLVWPVPSTQVSPHPQVIFPSKTWFFGIYLNFWWKKSFKNQYLPHSESKSYQINSIKLCSSRSFQQHQRHIPIPLKVSAMT